MAEPWWLIDQSRKAEGPLAGRTERQGSLLGVVANSSLYAEVFLDSGRNQASRLLEPAGFQQGFGNRTVFSA